MKLIEIKRNFQLERELESIIIELIDFKQTNSDLLDVTIKNNTFSNIE